MSVLFTFCLFLYMDMEDCSQLITVSQAIVPPVQTGQKFSDLWKALLQRLGLLHPQPFCETEKAMPLGQGLILHRSKSASLREITSYPKYLPLRTQCISGLLHTPGTQQEPSYYGQQQQACLRVMSVPGAEPRGSRDAGAGLRHEDTLTPSCPLSLCSV